MSRRFTKSVRQQIVEEFSIRHNGQFDPNLFFQEVRDTGETHPAYGWFQWDKDKAAHAHWIEQAREFARDLKVNFTVQEVGRKEAVTVRQTNMPLVMSPVDGRKNGGGYVLTDPNDPAHVAEHCRQAAVALRSWLSRYDSAVAHAGVSRTVVEAIAVDLEKVAAAAAPVAA